MRLLYWIYDNVWIPSKRKRNITISDTAKEWLRLEAEIIARRRKWLRIWPEGWL